jgi:hypothetical protein
MAIGTIAHEAHIALGGVPKSLSLIRSSIYPISDLNFQLGIQCPN